MPTSRPKPAAPAAPPSSARRARGRESDAGRFDFQSDSLGYALRRAQMRAYDIFFEMLGTLDLSPARLTALSIVAMEVDINQATLARRLDIAGPSVLKLVDALEQAGFISRMAVAGDRRRYSLVITNAGRGMLERARTELEAYEARLADQLTPDDRAQLMALLARVAS
jgi:DNA-binding MarR family transcriptional regulator